MKRSRRQIQHITAAVYDKRGRLLSFEVNSYVKTHPLQKKYAEHTRKPNRIYLHAEMAALIRARKFGTPHSIVVERKNKQGRPVLARPCDACMKAIMDFGIKHITWSMSIEE